MQERPIGPLVDALNRSGCRIRYLNRDTSELSQEPRNALPLHVAALNGKLPGGRMELSADVSSQFVSSIMLTAPYSEEEVTLVLVGGKVVSQPYIDLTIAMMLQFGVVVKRIDAFTYLIPRGAYTNPPEYRVEGDASSATYPLAWAAITGSTCRVMGVGSDSLQGDAQFATKVLQPMGCSVLQTAEFTQVTGPPPGDLQPLNSIDMETMTDAFLTAAVLFAVAAGGETRISGIANQRVKECDRIAATVTQLKNFSVECAELSDGLVVRGGTLNRLTSPKSGVCCFDDHRVAMSFSLLACVTDGGAIINEQFCVAKTWPGWWDCLSRVLGVEVDGVEGVEAKNFEVENFDVENVEAKKSNQKNLILIGMRGAGKSFLGQSVACHLRWNFVDLDLEIEKRIGMTISEFVDGDAGWEAFRSLETQVLREVLEDGGRVVACGGGVVERKENRNLLLHALAHVVHVRRDLAELAALYSSRFAHRPALHRSFDDVWREREPWYLECSQFEFLNCRGFVDFSFNFQILLPRILLPLRRAWKMNSNSWELRPRHRHSIASSILCSQSPRIRPQRCPNQFPPSLHFFRSLFPLWKFLIWR